MVFNTSFIFDGALGEAGRAWLMEHYVPAVRSAFGQCRAMAVVEPRDPDTITIAVQATAPSRQAIDDWLAQTGQPLIAALMQKYPERALAFNTIMQEL